MPDSTVPDSTGLDSRVRAQTVEQQVTQWSESTVVREHSAREHSARDWSDSTVRESGQTAQCERVVRQHLHSAVLPIPSVWSNSSSRSAPTRELTRCAWPWSAARCSSEGALVATVACCNRPLHSGRFCLFLSCRDNKALSFCLSPTHTRSVNGRNTQAGLSLCRLLCTVLWRMLCRVLCRVLCRLLCRLLSVYDCAWC